MCLCFAEAKLHHVQRCKKRRKKYFLSLPPFDPVWRIWAGENDLENRGMSKLECFISMKEMGCGGRCYCSVKTSSMYAGELPWLKSETIVDWQNNVIESSYPILTCEPRGSYLNRHKHLSYGSRWYLGSNDAEEAQCLHLHSSASCTRVSPTILHMYGVHSIFWRKKHKKRTETQAILGVFNKIETESIYGWRQHLLYKVKLAPRRPNQQ